MHIGHLAQTLCTLIICTILSLKPLENIQMLSSIVLEISTYRTWTGQMNQSINSHRYPLLINQEALDMMHDCSFAQIVNFPTRNDNILDLLFTNRPTLVQECYSTPGISDHEIIAATVTKFIYGIVLICLS